MSQVARGVTADASDLVTPIGVLGADGKWYASGEGGITILTETVTVTTTGSAGSATGSAVSESLSGFLLDIYFDFHADAPATTDTTVAFTDPVFGTIIVLTDVNTDGLYAPLRQGCDAAGDAIAGAYERFPLNGTLTVSLAQADALTGALVANIRYLRA